MNNVHPAGPLSPSERLTLLDALRGFALLGIMFVNMTWFTGFAVASPEARASLSTAGVDRTLDWLVHFAIDNKFWSLFALLFGVGFGILLARVERRGKNAVPLFTRRMTVLLAIGAVHAVFVWFGDIVSLYAVTGFALLLFRRSSDRVILGMATACLLSPIVVSGGILAADMATRAAGVERGDPGHGPGALLASFATGSYAEAFRANLAFLKERWVLAVYTGRFPALLGTFLLGYYVTRRRVLAEPRRHTRLLRSVLEWGLLIGVPANAWLATTSIPLRPPSLPGWVAASVRAIGVPALSLAYAAGFVLLYQSAFWRRVLSPLAWTGRMTLTNYIAQSLIGVVIFYGCGLGGWGRFGITWSIPLILAIFGLQTLLSALWLRRSEQGPIEWLWRRLTYGRWLPAAVQPHPAR